MNSQLFKLCYLIFFFIGISIFLSSCGTEAEHQLPQETSLMSFQKVIIALKANKSPGKCLEART